jgi:hypothetical protein
MKKVVRFEFLTVISMKMAVFWNFDGGNFKLL